MCILPKNLKLRNIPSVYLDGSKLVYVESFNYLGHTITTKFTDDEDIKKEMRKLCARGNTLIRKFKFCQSATKCNLFRTYCYSLYCAVLWSSFKRETLIRLKVNYNNIMRRFEGVPMFSSASQLFASRRVKSLPELLRGVMFGLMKRIECSSNTLILKIISSEIFLKSALWKNWRDMLYV